MDSSLASTKKYILYFSLIYAVILIITNILLNVFKIDTGVATNFVMLIAAAYGAAAKFVMDNRRVPNKQEKNLLLWGCLLVSIAILVIDMVIVIFLTSGTVGLNEMTKTLKTLPSMWWLIIITFVIVVEYLLLSMVYGWGARKFADKHQQKLATSSSD